MQRIIYFSVLIGVLVFSGCGKSGGPGKRELLTKAPWVFSPQTELVNGVYYYPYPGRDSCWGDNQWIFTRDHVLRITEGVTPCGSNSAGMVLEEHNWKIDYNDEWLSYGSRSNGRIVELNYNRLVLSNVDWIPGQFVAIFRHP